MKIIKHRGNEYMRLVVRAACQACGVTAYEVFGSGRNSDVVAARRIAVKIIRDTTDRSYPEISDFFGASDASHITAYDRNRRANVLIKAGDEKFINQYLTAHEMVWTSEEAT